MKQISDLIDKRTSERQELLLDYTKEQDEMARDIIAIRLTEQAIFIYDLKNISAKLDEEKERDEKCICGKDLHINKYCSVCDNDE